MQKTLISTLESLGIKELNAMQNQVLSSWENPGDLKLLSETGSGKTIAFLLPLLLGFEPIQRVTQAIIITPSRELALQIETVFKQMKSGFKVSCCYGGHKREIEENNLVDAPTLIIGTPGRLCDHIRRGNIRTDGVRWVVLDEFDKSLELGFQQEMAFLLGSFEKVEKKVLISATQTIELPDFLTLNKSTEISFLNDQNIEMENKLIDIKYLRSPNEDKLDTLFRFICSVGNRSMIIFCNQREVVEMVERRLFEKGINCVFYHGKMEQRDRDTALNRFRNGSVAVLITTDIAARGLDIPNVRYIVHFQLPQTEDVFTHRNGRTARMNASGSIVLLLSTKEYLPPFVNQDLEALILPSETKLPEKSKWVTLYVAAGKKNKVNKIDIVGFLTQKGELKKEDIGLIEVKDFSSFVAINRLKAAQVINRIKTERLKSKKILIEIAK